MIFNCSDTAHTVSLPGGSWQVLVDRGSSFRWQEDTFLTESCAVAPHSPLILGKR
jgi:hypothetical protein